ncbi:MAG: NAD(P)H-dependent oxidoreductase [Spirochaetota bacterium]
MQATTVLCHPFERSFCRAVADALRDGLARTSACSTFHDLYAEGPDPVLTGAEIARRFSLDDRIRAYSDEVIASDLLAVVHPDWWSATPALLKGWLDRVFRPGVAYDWQGEEFTEKQHVPLFSGKRLFVFVTTDRAEDDPPAPIEGFWRDVAAYSGMQLVHYRLYCDLRNSGIRLRRAWLQEAAELIEEAVGND